MTNMVLILSSDLSNLENHVSEIQRLIDLHQLIVRQLLGKGSFGDLRHVCQMRKIAEHKTVEHVVQGLDLRMVLVIGLHGGPAEEEIVHFLLANVQFDRVFVLWEDHDLVVRGCVLK